MPLFVFFFVFLLLLLFLRQLVFLSLDSVMQVVYKFCIIIIVHVPSFQFGYDFYVHY